MVKCTNVCNANALNVFMSLIYNLFVERQPPPPVIYKEYDFIIVGGGTAGCVIANRLSEIPSWDVLLLEAGVEQPKLTEVPGYILYASSSSYLSWNYMTVPEPQSCEGQPCPYERAKMLGGCSSHNFMIYNRGNRRCFDRWRGAGNAGWSYREVLEYFKKSEDNKDPEIASNTLYHSTGGELGVQTHTFEHPNGYAVLDGLIELGFPVVDYNGKSQYGCSLGQYTARDGARASTNSAFLAPIRHKRPNLSVVTQAMVTKILISKGAKRAYGVEFMLRERKKYFVLARKEVILSAGAINSPQILQLSGIGPAEVLTLLNVPIVQEMKGVGENFQDHPLHIVRMDIPPQYRPRFPQDQSELRSELNYYMRFHKGPLTGINWPISYWYSKMSYKQMPDIIFNFGFRITNCSGSQIQVHPTPYYDSLTVAVMLVTPRSRGYVRINSTNPFAAPLINMNLLADERDFEAIVDALKLLTKLTQSSTFRRMGIAFRGMVPRCSHLEIGSEEYWRCAVMGGVRHSFHGAGTCKMGPSSDPYAVVDSRLKVHRVSSLRVIDASIMPEIVNAHTNAATIMIAEKGSDMIKRTWLWC